MAQDFERTLTLNIDAALADIRPTSDSDDAIVGIRTVDVAITNNGDTVTAYLIKAAPIPVGGALELIDGGSKIILQSGDKLRAKSSVANSLDVVVSAVDAISE